MQKNAVDPNLTPYLKMNSKWINDLNIGAKNTKFLDKNPHDIAFSNLGYDTSGTDNKRKNKLDFLEIRNFCTTKRLSTE